jgi:hypothetical protein
MQTLKSSQNTDLFFVPVESINDDLAVVRSTAEKIAVADSGRTQNPTVVLMQACQRKDRFLLVHNPEVDGVVRRPGYEKLGCQSVDGVYRVERVAVD